MANSLFKIYHIKDFRNFSNLEMARRREIRKKNSYLTSLDFRVEICHVKEKLDGYVDVPTFVQILVKNELR